MQIIKIYVCIVELLKRDNIRSDYIVGDVRVYRHHNNDYCELYNDND